MNMNTTSFPDEKALEKAIQKAHARAVAANPEFYHKQAVEARIQALLEDSGEVYDLCQVLWNDMAKEDSFYASLSTFLSATGARRQQAIDEIEITIRDLAKKQAEADV